MKTPENMNKISAASLKPGMKFTRPLFFDDGVNMFAAEGIPLNRIHLDAVKNWGLKTVLTFGAEADEPDELEELDELEPIEWID